MRKFTLLLVLVALLAISTAVVYAGIEWDADPVGVWEGGKTARVLTDTGATVTFYNAQRASSYPGITVNTVDDQGADRVCVTQGFEVVIRGESRTFDSADCVNVPFGD